MAMSIKFDKESKPISVKVNDILKDINVDFDSGIEVEEHEKYSGEYVVTPTAGIQELQTENKLMINDVVVKAIPFEAVSNDAGGKTVTIGG